MTGQFLTTRDLAERWRVSDRTIRRLVAAGRLPVVVVGGSWRFQSDDVERFERSSYMRGAA